MLTVTINLFNSAELDAFADFSKRLSVIKGEMEAASKDAAPPTLPENVEAPRTRKRKTKTEPVVDERQLEIPTEPALLPFPFVEEPTAPAQEPPAPPSPSDVESLVKQLYAKSGLGGIRQVLMQFNATRVSEVPAEKQADLVAALQAALR
jgi:hypothetical protein